MKNLSLFLFSAIILAVFTQCKNDSANKAREKAEASAAAAKAEADSLKALLAAKEKAVSESNSNTSSEDGGLPLSSIKESGKLNPVDQGRLSKDFTDFRKKLMKAISKKDKDYLTSIIDKNIKLGFGGDETMESVWKLDSDPENSKIWQVLKNVLELGGTFDNEQQTTFTAPYVFTNFPQGYDAFEYAAVTGQGVRVRSEAKRTGTVTRNSSFDIVRLIPEDTAKKEIIGGEEHPWVKVQFSDDTEGYIYGKYVRSPIDYRASFQKKGDSWKMIFLVAGD